MVAHHMHDNLRLAFSCQARLASGLAGVSWQWNEKLTIEWRVNRQSGDSPGEVASSRSRCDLSHVQPKSEPRARWTCPFIEWHHFKSWYQGKQDTVLISGETSGGHPWYWYQSITRADANGGCGGCHLHDPRWWTVIGLGGWNNLCSHYSDRFL